MELFNQYGRKETGLNDTGRLRQLMSFFKRRSRIVDQFGREIESVIPPIGQTLNIPRPPRFKTIGASLAEQGIQVRRPARFLNG